MMGNFGVFQNFWPGSVYILIIYAATQLILYLEFLNILQLRTCTYYSVEVE